MKIGVAFPNLGRLASMDLLDLAVPIAEASGLADLWVGDHVAYPTTVEFPYPSYPSFAIPATDPILDPLAMLAHLAARTKRLRLGVSVLIIPYRNPVLAARMLATIDVLSRGRLICGAGAGWFAEEFEVLGADFAHRGAVTDEYLRLMARLWTEPAVTFEGNFYRCKAVAMNPKPVQQPRVPIWVGGAGRAAMRRAAELGDGWQPMAPDPTALARQIHEVNAMRQAAGRAQEPFCFSLRLVWGGQATAMSTGSAGLQIDTRPLLDALRVYRKAGAEHALITLRATSADHYLELLNHVSREVVPEMASIA